MNLKITKADRLFSLYIRHRDNFTCQKCRVYIQPPTNQIHSAHFESRRKKSVRFDPDNACALCSKCHMYFDGNSNWGIESHKQAHKRFWVKRLGKEKVEQLQYKANKTQKIDEKQVVAWLEIQLEQMGIKEYK